MHVLLLQICEKIPEKNITPQGGLAAIFQVMKDKTGVDINTYYRNKNKKIFDLPNVNECMKKVVPYLCSRDYQSYSNIFSYLPKDVTSYICSLTIKSMI